MKSFASIAAACAVAFATAPASAVTTWTFEFGVHATGTREFYMPGLPLTTEMVDQYFTFTRTFESFSGAVGFYPNLNDPRGDALGLGNYAANLQGTFDPVAGTSSAFGYYGDNCHILHYGCGSYQLSAPTFSVAFVSSNDGTGPVPEPATWALMTAGFGAIGGSMRRKRGVTAAVRLA